MHINRLLSNYLRAALDLASVAGKPVISDPNIGDL